jgi:hypothetical protein
MILNLSFSMFEFFIVCFIICSIVVRFCVEQLDDYDSGIITLSEEFLKKIKIVYVFFVIVSVAFLILIFYYLAYFVIKEYKSSEFIMISCFTQTGLLIAILKNHFHILDFSRYKNFSSKLGYSLLFFGLNVMIIFNLFV